MKRLKSRTLSSESDSGRVESLDGLRFCAIFFVALYHYYARWTSPISAVNFYPYGDYFASVPIFLHGHYGVQLFFVISGFVISITLERCKSWKEFVVRRIARLWPSMLLCSILTFCITRFFTAGFEVNALSFIPSLTFIDPAVYRKLFGADFNWIDGAYWSLFAEVRFYVFIAILYFSSRQRFLIHLYGMAFLFFIVFFISDAFGLGALKQAMRWLFFVDEMPWFLFGVSFFHFFRAYSSIFKVGMFGIPLLGVFLTAANSFCFEILVVVIVLGIFWMALVVSWFKRILSFPLMAKAGVASYSLYLLHQNVGVVLIERFSAFLGLSVEEALVVPLGVFLFLSYFSVCIYRLWERPADKAIVNVLMKRFSNSVTA